MQNQIALHIIWFLSAVLIYTEYCYFWQLKWYRTDRFRDLLSTKQGKNLLTDPYTLTKILVALILFTWWPGNHSMFAYAVFDIFLIDVTYTVFRKFKGVYRRPKFSLKAALIIGVSIGVEYLSFVLTRDWSLTLLVSSMRLVVLSIVVIGINATTNKIKHFYFKAAEKKLNQHKNLIKIGITGSYGKTSVKELLTQILSHKYAVACTPKNVNSDIGISRFILSQDFSNIDVCVIEMGAYGKGDIQLVCDIVHPTIGILTAINAQHLSLFGTLKDIQDTKYELLRSIPPSGLSITNRDNPLCMEYVRELSSTVQTFGSTSEYHPDCLVDSVNGMKQGAGLEVNYVIQSKAEARHLSIKTVLVGEHQAVNLAPCILVAEYLGMTAGDIQTAIEKITPPEHGITVRPFGKSIIIDDTYNSNPDGFKAALDVLGSFPSSHRRIVITRGMHELGDLSLEAHEKIGNEISFSADELVIITPDFADALKKGIIEKYTIQVKEIFETEKLVEYVQKLQDEQAVILFENKIPDPVRILYKN